MRCNIIIRSTDLEDGDDYSNSRFSSNIASFNIIDTDGTLKMRQ